MKLRLPNRLKAAVMAAVAAVVYATLGTATIGAAAQAAEETGKTLHVYILTGQSNSLGAVKGDPASADTLAYYSTAKEGDGIQMWNGNMTGSVSDNAPSKNLVVSDEGKTWQTVAPQAPTLTNLCMGPEYGFAYMMQKKGWEMSAGHDVAIIKGSRDGGPNKQWDKGASLYDLLLNSVVEALKHVDQGSYDSVELNGLMYLQGESNTTAAGADEKFAAFVSNLQADVQTKLAELAAADSSYAYLQDMVKVGGTSETLYAVAGESASWGNQGNAVTNGTAAALAGLAESSDTTGFVYTRDLDKITPGDGMGVHYDGNSEITIGARYAYAMAAEQGMDVTEGGTVRVRSQEYGDTFSAADRTPTDTTARTPLSLNEAAAWWRSAGEAATWTVADLADKVAVWDVSSANMLNTTQGTETLSDNLTVGGIRIEDPYAEDDTTGTHNATITIKNAEGANATLTVGNKGIELQRGNLSLQTKVATNGAQTWTVAGGKTLTVANSISGTDTVSLHKHANIASASAAQFDFSAATDAGPRTWSIGDGVSVALSDTGFAQSTLAVEAAASAALTGGQVTLGSLTLGNGAALDLTGGLTLSATNMTVADNVQLNFHINSGIYSSLSTENLSGTGQSAVSISLSYENLIRNKVYTLGSGWSGWTTDGSGNHVSLAQEVAGVSLSVDEGGQLLLTSSIGSNVAFIAAGETLEASSLHATAEDPVTVQGAGTLSLGELANKNGMVLPANVSLANDGTWTGSVLLTSNGGGDSQYGISNMESAKINALGTAYSEVEMKNLKGYFTSAHHNITANLRLTGEDALVVAAGLSSGYSLTFSGKLAGDGELENRYGNGNASVTFTGDISAWTGKFNQSSTAANGTPTLTLQGAATTINAEIAKPTQNADNGLNLTLGTITNGASGYTFNNAVSVTKLTATDKTVILGSNTKEDGTVTHGSLSVSGITTLGSLAMGEGTTAAFDGSLTIRSLSLDGNNNIRLGTSATLDASVISGTVGSGVTLSGTGKFCLSYNDPSGNTDIRMPQNITLAADWRGTVTLTGGGSHTGLQYMSNPNANVLFRSWTENGVTKYSTVELKGMSGYQNWQDTKANIILTGTNADGTGAGLTIVNGSSKAERKFSSSVSGAGDFVHAWANNNKYYFNGDVSGWTGSFKASGNSTTAVDLFFAGVNQTVNASVLNDRNATLNVTFDSEGAVMNGTIGNGSSYSGKDLALTVNKTTTFNNTVVVSTLTAADKTVILGTNGTGDSATHGALTVNGATDIGTLEVKAGATATLNGSGTVGTLKSEQGSATTLTNITVGSTGDCTLKGNLTIGNGATLNITGTDSLGFDSTNTVTVEKGGTLDFGTGRWTLKAGNSLVLNGGTIKGAGDGNNGALDFMDSGNVVRVTDDSVISAAIRLRNAPVTFDTAAGKKLTLSGKIMSNALVKSGNGTLLVKAAVNNTYSNGTTVNAGTLKVESTAEEALGTGSVTVAQNAVLEVAGALTVKGNTATSLSNAGTLKLDDGAALTMYATDTGRTYDVGTVQLVGTSASLSNRFHAATQNVASISGSSGSALSLISNHCSSSGTWNIGTVGGTSTYNGKLVLVNSDTDAPSAKNRTATFNFVQGNMLSGATLELKNGTYKSGGMGATMTNNVVLKADSVSFGGITDAEAESAPTRTVVWNLSKDASVSGHATLKLDGSGTYSTAATVGSDIDIDKSGSGTQSFSGDMSHFNGSVTATAGTLQLLNQTSVNVTDLTLQGTAEHVTTVGIYQGSSAASAEGGITVSGILTANEHATLNADLTLVNGATLAVSGENGLHMGSSLTLAQNAVINLSSELTVILDGMVRGESLTLFSGVDAFSIDGGAYDADATYSASDYFNLTGVAYGEHFVVRYEIPAGSVDGGTVSLYMATPEPATTTLSLLALAGLMARRRRH